MSNETQDTHGPVKSSRGFAAMDQRKQREIASKGGRAAHESGHAHEFTPEEAREADRKGGQVVSEDRAHMAAIGAKGGARSHARTAAVVVGLQSAGDTQN